MTLNILYTKQFERDLKKQKRRRKNLSKLAKIAKVLSEEQKLPAKYRNHPLTGNYKGRWECHIERDWLLIYQRKASTLIFERTGTHSDLF